MHKFFHNCLIALGANLPSTTGTPIQTLEKSLKLFPEFGLQPIRISRFFSTPAYPAGSGPDFVNAAALAETSLSPQQVLTALHDIETQLGRTRNNRWEARMCDLDLLSYDELVLPDRDTFLRWKDLPLEKQVEDAPEHLVLPHPRLQDRGFVLVPLADIAADWRHPVFGETVAEMVAALPETDIAGILPL